MYNNNLKKSIIPIIFGIISFLAISNSNSYSQCSMMKGHGNHSGHDMKSSNKSGDTTIIRKGIIDVYEIDYDKDGYVYQDQMDWNVISDKPGDCPICGMKLEEVKIKVAIRNLKENDFEVKE